MILADTSVWIDHFKRSNRNFTHLLLEGKIVLHSMVLGELSLGNFHKKERNDIFRLLNSIETIPSMSDAEVMVFVDRHSLYGHGIGWVDCHLLLSSHRSGSLLLTLDKKLQQTAKKLHLI
jgi:hypothetical protein